MSNITKLGDQTKEPKDKPKDSEPVDFDAIIKANKEKEEKLKSQRKKHNKKVTHDYELKK